MGGADPDTAIDTSLEGRITPPNPINAPPPHHQCPIHMDSGGPGGREWAEHQKVNPGEYLKCIREMGRPLAHGGRGGSIQFWTSSPSA